MRPVSVFYCIFSCNAQPALGEYEVFIVLFIIQQPTRFTKVLSLLNLLRQLAEGEVSSIHIITSLEKKIYKFNQHHRISKVFV